MENENIISLWGRKGKNMVKEDQRLLQLEMELKLWRKKLQNNRDEAEQEAVAKIKYLSSADVKNFSKKELATFYSQMMNGITTPSDYTVSRRA